MLAKAMIIFPNLNDILVATAEQIGNIVWAYGLSLSGKGLYHGISGNGYALLAMHKLYHVKRLQEMNKAKPDEKLKDELEKKSRLWYCRALMFGKAMGDINVVLQLEQ
jgi:agmatine/peptidylarginine deiminase